MDEILFMWWNIYHGSQNDEVPGADTGFQGRGAHLKKNCAERRKNVWIFRLKNHDFTPKNHIFPILGGRAGCVPPWFRT